jgi:S-adenosylmethionine synthetase
MYEKVNPSHPDKVADRIAGALVDLAYAKAGGLKEATANPKIAAEVLIGHGLCTVILETSEEFTEQEVCDIVHRIAGPQEVRFICVKQDIHLAKNQHKGIRCGDNGIFKGSPVSQEQHALSQLARELYEKFPTDGKFIAHHGLLVVCQSNAKKREIGKFLEEKGQKEAVINPLGEWTGGCNVDCGATNRKLGSDMADGVTGGGLHGKDLSKADVSVNIFCHLMAQKTNRDYRAVCAIGDEKVNGVAYTTIVNIAREYINSLGGFEKFAEWGLI